MIKNNYLLGASEADRRFHDYLIGSNGNKRLKAVYYRAPLPMIHDEIADSQYWENPASQSERTLPPTSASLMSIITLLLSRSSRESRRS
jgi:hypothetical protein